MWSSTTSILLLYLLVLEVAAFQQNFGKIGFFWHIDSLHFDANFTLSGDRNNYCWKDPDTPSILRPNGQLGDYHCDSSGDLLTSVFAFMKSKMGDNIDFILWTGNSVPQSPNFPVANASAHEAVLQRVTEMFKLNFPYTTVYPALGNLDVLHPRILEASESSSSFGKTREADHYGSGRSGHKKRRKWYGSNHHETTTASPEKATYDHVAHLWQNWLPPTAINTLQRGGYYTIELAGSRIRLVSLNMNLYMEDIMDEMKFRRTHLRGRGGGVRLKGGDPSLEAVTDPDPMGQWAWLSSIMEKAEKKRQNVIIFGHSPPGKYERSFQVSKGASTTKWSQHWLQERFNHKYLEFVRKYAHLIVGQFFGHQHSDSFRIFRDVKGKPISWAMLNPSVSPFKISANGLVVESSNPAVRLYRYNTHTGEIYDYAQYYLDLADANRKIEQKVDSNNIKVASPANEEALLAASSLTSAGASGSSGGPNNNFRSGKNGLWRVEYNFTSLYQVHSGLNAASMDQLTKKMSSNSTWFDAYFRTNMVNYEAAWSCDQMCRHAQTCAINFVDYSDYAYCVNQASASAVDQGYVGAGINGVPEDTRPKFLLILCLLSILLPRYFVMLSSW